MVLLFLLTLPPFLFPPFFPLPLLLPQPREVVIESGLDPPDHLVQTTVTTPTRVVVGPTITEVRLT